jgi:hypothetical protein
MIASRFLLAFFLVLLVDSVSGQDQECANPEECADPVAVVADDVGIAVTDEDPSCPSRPHIIRCASHYLDKNKNNKLEKSELQDAIDLLPWYSRGILKIIGSVDKIMKKCDYDKDGAISIDSDMENTKETCLATCFKKKAFKSAFFPECDK